MTGTILQNKAAIITGAGRGIGRAIAETFAAAGAAVVITARSGGELEETAAKVKAAGGRAVAIAADVGDPATASKLVRAALDHAGGCDILINAAGIDGPAGEIESVGLDEWNEVFRINMTGTFLTCKAAVPEMKRRGGGRIINVSSGLATRPQPGLAAYSATKAAVVQFSRVLAEELRDFGIRVNAVHPGLVRTAMIAHMAALEGEGARRLVRERMRSFETNGILIEPAQSARFFLWAVAGCERTGDFLRIDDPAALAEMEAYFKD